MTFVVPVCVMVAEPEDWHCRVVVGNDSRQPGCGRCRITDADSGQTVLEAGFAVEANANRDLGRLRVSRGEQRLLLIEWELEAGQGGPGRGGNHYLVGSPPVSLTAYRRWLPRIAGLPLGFAADQAAR